MAAGAVDLRNKLASAFGTEIPSTIIFDYPSVSMLAAFILSTTSPAPVQDKRLADYSPAADINAREIRYSILNRT